MKTLSYYLSPDRYYLQAGHAQQQGGGGGVCVDVVVGGGGGGAIGVGMVLVECGVGVS